MRSTQLWPCVNAKKAKAKLMTCTGRRGWKRGACTGVAVRSRLEGERAHARSHARTVARGAAAAPTSGTKTKSQRVNSESTAPTIMVSSGPVLEKPTR